MYIISLAWPTEPAFNSIAFYPSIRHSFPPVHLHAFDTHTHTLSLSGGRTSNACPSATPSALHCVSFSSGAAVVLFHLFLLSELTGGPSVCHTSLIVASSTGSSFESRSLCLVLSIVKNAPKACSHSQRHHGSSRRLLLFTGLAPYSEGDPLPTPRL